MCSNFYLSSQLQLLLSEVISPWLRFNCLSAHAVKCRLNAQVPKGCVSSVAAARSAVMRRQLVLCGRQTVQRARRSFAEYSCPVKLANLQKSGCHVWYTHFLPRTPPPKPPFFLFPWQLFFFWHCTERKTKIELLAISEMCLFCGSHSIWLFTTRRICLFRCDLTGKRKVSWLLWQPAEWLVGFDISTEWKRVETGGWWYCWRQIRAMCHWATAPRHSPRLLLAGISSKRERVGERERK